MFNENDSMYADVRLGVFIVRNLWSFVCQNK